MRKTKKLTLSALFLALGIVMPFLTMQLQSLGNMLLPMHIPVLLCGFICGGGYGFVVGLSVPLLRSLIFGMPIMMPNAITMVFELATYGLVAGLLYSVFKKKRLGAYFALIVAMIVGRAVWGGVSYGVYSLFLEDEFTWKIFFAGAFINAFLGIILQILIIPPIVMLLEKKGVLNR